MTINCPLCKTVLEDGSEGDIAVRLQRSIEDTGGWDRYPAFKLGMHYMIDGKYDAEIVAIKDSWDDGLDSDTSAYSHQGDVFEAFIIFKVDDFFYRKTGSGDSYGEVSWDGTFGPVRVQKKIVEVYEYV